MVVPERSPSPPKEVTDSNRIGAEEDIDDFKVPIAICNTRTHKHSLSLPCLQGKTEEEVRKIMSQREAQANAQILEMVGDIPDADAKPPENVLFVCKLNPATTGEDLEIIFSRFGAILTCEVIKDQKTGDSLQYAFIEFENEEDCVSAYFKMDNVLIDDRRIHVDFCQSLAKVKGVRRRKLSSEKESLADRFAPRSQKSGGDGYEMVFDVEGGSKGARDRRIGRDREGERRGREREGGREKRREGGGRERKEERRHRSRSRSRDRDRHHKNRHRNRSRDRR